MMRKILLIALVALFASCTNESGVKIVVENESGEEITNLCCYTVIEGDTIIKAESLSDKKRIDVKVALNEKQKNLNYIFEFTHTNGHRESEIASFVLSEDLKSVVINLKILDNSTNVEYITK